MIEHTLIRCTVKAAVDVPIRSGKVYFQNFLKLYVLTSAVAQWISCVAIELIPGAEEHPFLSKPAKGAFVYYARAIPKGEDIIFKTCTGIINGAAYAALSNKTLLDTEPLLIETAETAVVNWMKGKEFTVAGTLPGFWVGLSIFGLSKVAKAINELLIVEPVEAPLANSFNTSNVDMCMIGETDKSEES